MAAAIGFSASAGPGSKHLRRAPYAVAFFLELAVGPGRLVHEMAELVAGFVGRDRRHGRLCRIRITEAFRATGSRLALLSPLTYVDHAYCAAQSRGGAGWASASRHRKAKSR